ncbi:unnamed protein product [Cyclocybe aegerita]|uniref:Uncharacterized protein n=1 Tax=Cyclocybe aegerita TaxID=1973307 RepID=A0A8S0W069_CYCAE|nr:unnamed protein product [Cyclocybe aegerita]
MARRDTDNGDIYRFHYGSRDVVMIDPDVNLVGGEGQSMSILDRTEGVYMKGGSINVVGFGRNQTSFPYLPPVQQPHSAQGHYPSQGVQYGYRRAPPPNHPDAPPHSQAYPANPSYLPPGRSQTTGAIPPLGHSLPSDQISYGSPNMFAPPGGSSADSTARRGTLPLPQMPYNGGYHSQGYYVEEPGEEPQWFPAPERHGAHPNFHRPTPMMQSRSDGPPDADLAAFLNRPRRARAMSDPEDDFRNTFGDSEERNENGAK